MVDPRWVDSAGAESAGFHLDSGWIPGSRVSTLEATFQAFVIALLFLVRGVDSTRGGLPKKRPCR